MYMDLNLATLVEATIQEDIEEHHQENLYQRRVLGLEVVQEIAPSSSLDRRGGYHDDDEQGGEQREHMFDKVLTPSDVGKLNRLVVPKQQAERYFPAAAAGTQLCFEDRAGMPWRFRYSYWGSSQSYVMTKGWSRFVRAARLAAGDTVSFSRSLAGARAGRYFIDYHHCQRRRRNISFGDGAVPAAWPFFGRVQTSAAGGGSTAAMVLDTVPVVDGAGHHVEVRPKGPKRFRLFGVNVECGGGVDEMVATEEEDDVDLDRGGEERAMVM